MLALAVHDYFRQGGVFAIVAGDTDQLERAGALFNLLVVPGDPPADVAAAAVRLAEERGAICILDPPALARKIRSRPLAPRRTTPSRSQRATTPVKPLPRWRARSPATPATPG